MNRQIVLASLALSALVVGSLAAWWYLRSPRAVAPPESKLPREKVELYFLHDRHYELRKVVREIPEAKDSAQRITQIIEQLTVPPDSPALTPLLPPEARLRTVFLGDRTVYLDFNDALIGAAQGSSGEMYLLYSVVNSVLVNLPEHYKFVQFLVEGETRKTIGPYGEESGHIAIQYPLGPRWNLAGTS